MVVPAGTADGQKLWVPAGKQAQSESAADLLHQPCEHDLFLALFERRRVEEDGVFGAGRDGDGGSAIEEGLYDLAARAANYGCVEIDLRPRQRLSRPRLERSVWRATPSSLFSSLHQPVTISSICEARPS